MWGWEKNGEIYLCAWDASLSLSPSPSLSFSPSFSLAYVETWQIFACLPVFPQTSVSPIFFSHSFLKVAQPFSLALREKKKKGALFFALCLQCQRLNWSKLILPFLVRPVLCNERERKFGQKKSSTNLQGSKIKSDSLLSCLVLHDQSLPDLAERKRVRKPIIIYFLLHLVAFGRIMSC